MLSSTVRRAIGALLFYVYSLSGINAQPVVPKEKDKLQPANTATMTGFVGDKLDGSYRNRIMAQDVDRLIEPFQNRTEDRCWQTEFWGKWFTSAVQAYRYKPEPGLKSVIDHAVTGLLATQTSDGYIGNYTEARHLEQWDIWGRKYCMLGLLAYYDLTNDAKSLQATVRLADHLIKELDDKNVKIVSKGNHRGMAASSVLEPIVLLYTRTGEKRFLAFAQEIVKEWESPDGPQLIAKASINVGERFPIPKSWFGYEQGQKAYEMMSCYEGLLELYRVTGEPSYKTTVEKVWENIYDTEINVVGSGTSMECWFGGKKLQTQVAKHYQETCVTATWIKLSQQLLRLTGEAKYADAIEQSFYNGLLGSMKPDGADWAKYSPILGIRSEGEDQCHMGLNCCVASGPRGLFTIPLTNVMRSERGLTVNFYNPGAYTTKSPKGQDVEIVEETSYPIGSKINLVVRLKKAENFQLAIRIPSWSRQSTLLVNGDTMANLMAGEYSTLTRNWKNGDQITLVLDMRGRIERIAGRPSYEAIVRGPIVLARDNRMAGDADVDETISTMADKDGFIPLEMVPVIAGENVWMSFKTPCMVGSYRAEASGKPVLLTFCDYASAGNTYNEKSRFRIWLPQLIDPQQP